MRDEEEQKRAFDKVEQEEEKRAADERIQAKKEAEEN